MAKIARVSSDRRALNGRRAITVELPEFLLQALEVRVAEANIAAIQQEDVTLDHLLELELAESLSIGEIATLEQKVPGIGEPCRRGFEKSIERESPFRVAIPAEKRSARWIRNVRTIAIKNAG